MLYPARNPFRRFKKAHRQLYYVLKYIGMVGTLALAVVGGYWAFH